MTFDAVILDEVINFPFYQKISIIFFEIGAWHWAQDYFEVTLALVTLVS
jgi:hypothetical protein